MLAVGPGSEPQEEVGSFSYLNVYSTITGEKVSDHGKVVMKVN